MNNHYKYLILGAGPAGLSFATKLKKNGEEDFLIIEKENEAGGLCRSKIVDGSYLDIGGGHFLDTRRKEVVDFLFEFMPESEWSVFKRKSVISFNNKYIDHPFESNIWQLDTNSQIDFIKSVFKAGCNNGKKEPTLFIDWIKWKLGNKIANEYMIPYNSKLYGRDLNILDTNWLNKLPNVSFDDILLSCLEHKAYGSEPAHSTFLYPKSFGYGEIWLRMAKKLSDSIVYNEDVNYLDINKKEIKTKNGLSFTGDIIVSTLPWSTFKVIKGLTKELVESIEALKHNSVVVSYHTGNIDSNAHWIYCPEPHLSYHRILVRHNFLPNSKGFWTETNLHRFNKNGNVLFCYINNYAYPLNTIGKEKIVKRLLTYTNKHSIYGLGRWGEHQHYNSDVVVEKAINLADFLSNLHY